MWLSRQLLTPLLSGVQLDHLTIHSLLLQAQTLLPFCANVTHYSMCIPVVHIHGVKTDMGSVIICGFSHTDSVENLCQVVCEAPMHVAMAYTVFITWCSIQRMYCQCGNQAIRISVQHSSWAVAATESCNDWLGDWHQCYCCLRLSTWCLPHFTTIMSMTAPSSLQWTSVLGVGMTSTINCTTQSSLVVLQHCP